MSGGTAYWVSATPLMIVPLNTGPPLASLISTLWSTLASSFLKSIVNGWSAAAWIAVVVNARFCAARGITSPAGSPDGGGGGDSWAFSICSWTQAS